MSGNNNYTNGCCMWASLPPGCHNNTSTNRRTIINTLTHVTYQPTETIAPTESNESTANSFINADIVVVLPAGNPNRGEQRSRRLGCHGCHANYPDKIPPFNSTADLPRIDERGELRIADPNYAGNTTKNQEYFIESIIFPGLYLAPGEYTRSMPAYLEEQIVEQDIAEILAWLATLD